MSLTVDYSQLQGEEAPDLTEQELEKLRMVTKKTTTKKPAPRKPSAPKPAPVVSAEQLLAALPYLAQARLGWKPSITKYAYDPKELSKYMRDPSFNAQTPMNQPGEDTVYEVGGFLIQEIGAYTEMVIPPNGDARQAEPKDFRVVKVMDKK